MQNQRLDDCGYICFFKNELQKLIGGAAHLEQRMVQKNFRVTCSEECHPNGLRGSLDGRLLKREHLLNV